MHKLESWTNTYTNKHINSAHLLCDQLENNLNFIDRIIYLEEPIDIYTPSFIKERVNIINILSGDNKKPITLEITSFGGDAYGALATIDTISNIKTPINTLGRGAIMSAAAFILAAAPGKRMLTENAVVMIHEVSTWFGGTSKDIMTQAEHIKKLQKQLFKLLETYSNKDSKFWEENTKSNFYLSVKECLEHGLIDEIKTN